MPIFSSYCKKIEQSRGLSPDKMHRKSRSYFFLLAETTLGLEFKIQID